MSKKREIPRQHQEKKNICRSHQNWETRTEEKEQSTCTGYSHSAADYVPSNHKANRRFIRISSQRKWKQQKKVHKRVQRGKKNALNNSDYRLFGKALSFVQKPNIAMT